jgi:hypothetical protein
VFAEEKEIGYSETSAEAGEGIEEIIQITLKKFVERKDFSAIEKLDVGNQENSSRSSCC